MSDKGFDASRYLVKLKGKDYLEVKWRLLWLRTEHPEAVVETELVHFIQNPPMAVFKARISIPGSGSATGWGSEEAADFGDYLEKAETKAIGRALGALGYGTQFTTDFEFVDGNGEQRVVDSPVERNGTRTYTQTDRERQAAARAAIAPIMAGRPETRPAMPASEPQIKAIYAIGRGAQSMDEAEIEARSRELFGVTPSELSRRQASEFIDALKAGGRMAQD